MQRATPRQRVEDLPRSHVLCRRPHRRLLGLAVLQPPVGIVHHGAVQHLDYIAHRRDRCSRNKRSGHRSAHSTRNAQLTMTSRALALIGWRRLCAHSSSVGSAVVGLK